MDLESKYLFDAGYFTNGGVNDNDENIISSLIEDNPEYKHKRDEREIMKKIDEHKTALEKLYDKLNDEKKGSDEAIAKMRREMDEERKKDNDAARNELLTEMAFLKNRLQESNEYMNEIMKSKESVNNAVDVLNETDKKGSIDDTETVEKNNTKPKTLKYKKPVNKDKHKGVVNNKKRLKEETKSDEERENELDEGVRDKYYRVDDDDVVDNVSEYEIVFNSNENVDNSQSNDEIENDKKNDDTVKKRGYSVEDTDVDILYEKYDTTNDDNTLIPENINNEYYEYKKKAKRKKEAGIELNRNKKQKSYYDPEDDEEYIQFDDDDTREEFISGLESGTGNDSSVNITIRNLKSDTEYIDGDIEIIQDDCYNEYTDKSITFIRQPRLYEFNQKPINVSLMNIYRDQPELVSVCSIKLDENYKTYYVNVLLSYNKENSYKSSITNSAAWFYGLLDQYQHYLKVKFEALSSQATSQEDYEIYEETYTNEINALESIIHDNSDQFDLVFFINIQYLFNLFVPLDVLLRAYNENPMLRSMLGTTLLYLDMEEVHIFQYRGVIQFYDEKNILVGTAFLDIENTITVDLPLVVQVYHGGYLSRRDSRIVQHLIRKYASESSNLEESYIDEDL